MASRLAFNERKVRYGHFIPDDPYVAFDEVHEFEKDGLKILIHCIARYAELPSSEDVVIMYRGKIVLMISDDSNRPFLYVPGNWEKKI